MMESFTFSVLFAFHLSTHPHIPFPFYNCLTVTLPYSPVQNVAAAHRLSLTVRQADNL